MIDPQLAQQLKDAGLEWQPTKRDNFMIPGGELSNEVFTLNDLTILVQPVNGEYTVMFHGSAEWALDNVLLADVVWLPSEAQLRDAIQFRLRGDTPELMLIWNPVGYRCAINHLNDEYAFEGETAERAYAYALLFLLNRERLSRGRWVHAA
ncbi:MAG TPA: hypothetical protein VGD69_20725 [Herpetosiphonaceae bacterium]